MSFKKWSKTKEARKYCNNHVHTFDDLNSYRKIDCEECIWEAGYIEGIYEEFEALWNIYVKSKKSSLTEGAIKLRILLQKIKKEASK